MSSSKKTSFYRCAAVSGFSLIELLATIAVIGLLAALVFASTKGVITNSKQLKCASNLRQIGLAAAAWSADNNGRIVPVFDPGDDDGQNKLGLPHWTGLLAPYFDKNPTNGDFSSPKEMAVYICPEKSDTFGYGYNYQYLSYRQAGAGKIWGWPDDGYWATYASLPKPSQTVMMTDVVNVASPSTWRPFVRVPGQGDDLVIDFRHSGKTANVLWADGHVSAERSDGPFMTDLSLWGKR